MESSADFIARHALLVLLAAVLFATLAAAVVWISIERLAPRTWNASVAMWNVVRALPLARRLRRTPVIGPMLRNAMSAARYLGVVAVIGFLLAAGAIVLFVEIADEIGVGESLEAFDVALSAALRSHASHSLLAAFSWITRLGDAEFLAGLVLVVFVALLNSRARLLAFAWLIATASGGLLNRALKALFERTRPLHDHGWTIETSWSFPSGHASGAMVVYGLLAYVLVLRVRPAWRIPIALAGVVLIVFVGSSRVLLQVHYLSDVLAGYVVAAAWVAICIGALEAVRWRASGRNQLHGAHAEHGGEKENCG